MNRDTRVKGITHGASAPSREPFRIKAPSTLQERLFSTTEVQSYVVHCFSRTRRNAVLECLQLQDGNVSELWHIPALGNGAAPFIHKRKNPHPPPTPSYLQLHQRARSCWARSTATPLITLTLNWQTHRRGTPVIQVCNLLRVSGIDKLVQKIITSTFTFSSVSNDYFQNYFVM